METKIELLAPAKNADQGIAAINHGADAVYIGAPLFGARMAAGNSIDEIERLVNHAHLFGSKVFATVNTLLYDKELEEAEKLIWSLYNIGIDAVIVQDMGILELNLPAIELHASTQTHNIDIRRIKFLEQVGFSRIILARETSLEQMEKLRKETSAELEAFVQGALCVCYSGQCYMSLYLNNRSGNRGTCAQPCRSSYDLINSNGKVLRRNEHLLSLKDFSAAQHIEDMIDAGITSFKIEGRLKDLSYVKNVTAYYRRIIDDVIARRKGALKASSSGRTTFSFEPDIERTFNRGFTDYFLKRRQKMASPSTQKSLGKKIGEVSDSKGNRLVINSLEKLSAGDGICYFNAERQLEGFLINAVNGNQVIANKELKLKRGTQLWRNNDFLYEKQLQGNTSERKISVSMTLAETNTGFSLTMKDEEGCVAQESVDCQKILAEDKASAHKNIEKQLLKLGATAFTTNDITIQTSNDYFIPSSTINELRRKTVDSLAKTRIEHFHPKYKTLVPNDIAYFETSLDGKNNIINHKAEQFYLRHGVTHMEPGPDSQESPFWEDNTKLPLMTCKYCLRYELGQCLKHKHNNEVDSDYMGTLFLRNNGRLFRLFFDCQKCEMQLFSK